MMTAEELNLIDALTSPRGAVVLPKRKMEVKEAEPPKDLEEDKAERKPPPEHMKVLIPAKHLPDSESSKVSRSRLLENEKDKEREKMPIEIMRVLIPAKGTEKHHETEGHSPKLSAPRAKNDEPEKEKGQSIEPMRVMIPAKSSIEPESYSPKNGSNKNVSKLVLDDVGKSRRELTKEELDFAKNLVSPSRTDVTLPKRKSVMSNRSADIDERKKADASDDDGEGQMSKSTPIPNANKSITSNRRNKSPELDRHETIFTREKQKTPELERKERTSTHKKDKVREAHKEGKGFTVTEQDDLVNALSHPTTAPPPKK